MPRILHGGWMDISSQSSQAIVLDSRHLSWSDDLVGKSAYFDIAPRFVDPGIWGCCRT